ncbi:hypothetical protein DSO57_1037631 [Entomophthora muscae]|uniref:Uncharacterized protein n=1 Tax=Entomophthora muscae TaxID=34485 RepID=A0ACC2TKN3_9FUNG|nr:hypothetical protein DSO57_1037631 [Entomophthora muscae]
MDLTPTFSEPKGLKTEEQGKEEALNQDVFPRPSKKAGHVQAKPLQNLEDLAHTVDVRFVLVFTAESPIPSLESPPTMKETLIQLDCLLSCCQPVLRQLAGQRKNAGHMAQDVSNPWPGKTGHKISQSAESQESDSSSPGVPQPKVIRFGSPPVGTSEEGIRGNVHPESLECS